MAWYILTADQYVPLGGTQQMFLHRKGRVWRIAKRNMNFYKLHAAQCINTRSFVGFREISSVILHEVVQSALRRIGIHWYREQLGRKDRDDGGVYSCISMPNIEKYVWYYLVSFVPNCYWSSKTHITIMGCINLSCHNTWQQDSSIFGRTPTSYYITPPLLLSTISVYIMIGGLNCDLLNKCCEYHVVSSLYNLFWTPWYTQIFSFTVDTFHCCYHYGPWAWNKFFVSQECHITFVMRSE